MPARDCLPAVLGSHSQGPHPRRPGLRSRPEPDGLARRPPGRAGLRSAAERGVADGGRREAVCGRERPAPPGHCDPDVRPHRGPAGRFGGRRVGGDHRRQQPLHAGPGPALHGGAVLPGGAGLRARGRRHGHGCGPAQHASGHRREGRGTGTRPRPAGAAGDHGRLPEGVGLRGARVRVPQRPGHGPRSGVAGPTWRPRA